MHTRVFRRQRYGGFTILELLLSITIVGLILTVVYSAFTAGSRACTAGGERAQIFHTARLAMQDIIQSIENVEYGKTNYLSFVELDDGPGQGRSGSDTLEFATATKPTLMNGRWHAGLARIRYTINQEGDVPVLEKWVTRVEDDQFHDAYILELSENIADMEFRYLDEQDYTEIWDSDSKEKLPELVEVTLYVQEGDFLQPFRCAAMIPDMKVKAPSASASRSSATPTAGSPGGGEVSRPTFRDGDPRGGGSGRGRGRDSDSGAPGGESGSGGSGRGSRGSRSSGKTPDMPGGRPGGGGGRPTM
jgi:hypothetical protein